MEHQGAFLELEKDYMAEDELTSFTSSRRKGESPEDRIDSKSSDIVRVSETMEHKLGDIKHHAVLSHDEMMAF